MKKVILLFIMLFVFVSIYAQTTPPQYINYQAIVRKSGGEINANKKVRIEFRILKYPGLVEITERSEFHIQTTSDLGLVNVQIGKGTLISGKPFSEINWRDSLKLGITIYNDVGQLLVGPITQDFASTPYALYALKSGSTLDNTWTTIDTNIYRANGRVGIGIQYPTDKFHVNEGIGRFTFEGATMRLEGKTHTYLEFYPKGFSNGRKGYFGYPCASCNNLDIENNNQPITINGIDGSGAVGIGTYTPGAKLHVKGEGGVLRLEGKTHSYMEFYPHGPNNRKGYLGYPCDNCNNLDITNSDNNAVTLNAGGNGNVGIGTSTPGAKLDVNGNLKLRGAGRVFSIDVTNGFSNFENPNGGGVFYEVAGSEWHTFGGHILTDNSDLHGLGIPSRPVANAYVKNLTRTGVLEITGGNDIVEKFKSKEILEAGVLVTIDETDIHNYKTTNKAYQKGIVGIVSGANGVKHGMLLEQDDALAGNTKVAIAGRVYVKATAQNGAIKAGDLLTSSDKAGYAMKVTSRKKAFGSVVGKALTSLDEGEGYVLVFGGFAMTS